MPRLNLLIGVVALVALVVVGWLGWQLHVQTTELASRDDYDHLLLEKTCAAQAEKVFQYQGYDKPTPGQLAGYTNHYNDVLRKCFMRITTTDTSTLSTKGYALEYSDLTDAFEGVDYGSYLIEVAKGTLHESVVVCALPTKDDNPKRCHSKSEWEKAANYYLR